MNTLNRLMAFLLGDGGIENSNGIRNCRIRFTHGPKQESYLKWKVIELEKLGFKCTDFETRDVKYKSGSVYRSIQVRFAPHRLFTEAYLLIYPKGRKQYGASWVNGETVDDYAMAIWWMDDGSLHYRKNLPDDKICGYLNTFTDNQETLFLKLLFESKLNTEIRIHRRRDKYVLYFPHIALKRLLARIAPWVHDTMWYKCSIIRGEDGKPIIPTSAEQLRNQLKI